MKYYYTKFEFKISDQKFKNIYKNFIREKWQKIKKKSKRSTKTYHEYIFHLKAQKKRKSKK